MKIILGKAAASPNHEEYPKKEIHAVLMFVKTDDNEKAKKIARVEMQNKHWRRLKLSRIGSINVATFNTEDNKITNAFNSAQETGFGLRVYSEIEKSLDL